MEAVEDFLRAAPAVRRQRHAARAAKGQRGVREQGSLAAARAADAADAAQEADRIDDDGLPTMDEWLEHCSPDFDFEALLAENALTSDPSDAEDAQALAELRAQESLQTMTRVRLVCDAATPRPVPAAPGLQRSCATECEGQGMLSWGYAYAQVVAAS